MGLILQPDITIWRQALCRLTALAVLLLAPAAAEAEDHLQVDPADYGKVIKAIEFDTPVNLSYRELMFGLPIRRTNRLNPGDLEASVAALRRRAIFGEITVKVEKGDDGVFVNFDLPPEPTISEAVFRGYSLLDEQRLRRLAGLRLGSPISAEELDAAVQRIKIGYQNYGIYSPSIRYELRSTAFESMRVAEFFIDEGRQSLIGEVEIAGEFPENVDYLRQRFIDKAIGTAATKSDITALKQELLQALRQEGYLQASVEIGKSDFLLLTGDLRITVKVQTRTPIGILFVGNTVFSDKELLESLKIATRAVPFSPNAIETLTREITDLYQTHGHYFATAVHEALSADGNRRLYQITIYEGPQVAVSAVNINGNLTFSEGELRERIHTKPAGVWLFRRWSPGYLVQHQIDQDLAAIEEFYAVQGFPETKAVLQVTEEPGADRLIVDINISEGSVAPAKKVTIRLAVTSDRDETASDTGSSDIELSRIQPQIESTEPLSQERVEKERLKILNAVTALGYPRSEVSAAVDVEKQSVEFVVTPGRKVSVGSIFLAGNMFTRDYVIRRELLISTGGPWDRDLVRLTEQHLSSLGIFRSAEIQPVDGVLDGPVEDMLVKVAERESGTIDAGIAFDTEDGIHLSGRLGNRNFDGEGRDLLLGVDGYVKTGTNFFDAGHLQATYRIPRALSGFFSAKGDLYLEAFGQYSIELIDQYDYNRSGLGLSYHTPLTENLNSTFGIREIFDNLYNVQPDVIIGEHDEGSTFYSIFQGQLDLEQRDDIYNPRKGFRSLLQYSLSSHAIGSEADFVGSAWKNSFYFPLRPDLVWANSITVQLLEPFGSSDTIPLDQRIFLGGRGSLRGFSRYAIGPRGFDKDIAGGDRAVIFNTELQYQFAEDLVGITFLDAGQSYLVNKGEFEGDANSFDDLRYSPGLGLRYLTPIGPLSAEYGFALDREFGERFGRFTLSVGGAF